MIKILTALGILALSLIVFILAAVIVSMIAMGITMLIGKIRRLKQAKDVRNN